jgi:putative addiction module CopG family antidote
MSVSIPAELRPLIDKLVASGAFATEEAVVSEALRRLLDDQARFEKLKSTFDEAIAELKRGDGTPLDFADVKRKAHAVVQGHRVA